MLDAASKHASGASGPGSRCPYAMAASSGPKERTAESHKAWRNGELPLPVGALNALQVLSRATRLADEQKPRTPLSSSSGSSEEAATYHVTVGRRHQAKLGTLAARATASRACVLNHCDHTHLPAIIVFLAGEPRGRACSHRRSLYRASAVRDPGAALPAKMGPWRPPRRAHWTQQAFFNKVST